MTSRPTRFWLLTGAAVLGVVVTLALARWQLGRAADKEALLASIESQARLPALSVQSLRPEEDLKPLLHRPVVLRGTWLPQQSVYLDNRQMFGRPGFYVLTPLRLEGGGSVIVQRGWIARDFLDRTRLAPVVTPPGPVEIAGRMAGPPSHLLQLGADTTDASAKGHSGGLSRIRQNLDLAAFRAETGLALAEGSVVQLGAAGEGLQRDWPVAASGAAKNYGYAFQWFGLCALIAFLYAWFQFIAPRRRKQPS